MTPNPPLSDVLYVMANLRQKSHDEIFGVIEMDPVDYATWLWKASRFMWCGYTDAPAAILGGVEDHRGVWSLYGFGTAEWGAIWRDVTKTGRRDLTRAVKAAGAHRAQCITRADHYDTHLWLRGMGLTLEAQLPRYGRDGTDYTMFAWTKDMDDVSLEAQG